MPDMDRDMLAHQHGAYSQIVADYDRDQAARESAFEYPDVGTTGPSAPYGYAGGGVAGGGASGFALRLFAGIGIYAAIPNHIGRILLRNVEKFGSLGVAHKLDTSCDLQEVWRRFT